MHVKWLVIFPEEAEFTECVNNFSQDLTVFFYPDSNRNVGGFAMIISNKRAIGLTCNLFVFSLLLLLYLFLIFNFVETKNRWNCFLGTSSLQISSRNVLFFPLRTPNFKKHRSRIFCKAPYKLQTRCLLSGYTSTPA